MNVMAAHGTETHYRDGCRCVKCKAAHAKTARDRRARNPVARTGTSKQPAIGKVVALPKSQTAGVASQMGANVAGRHGTGPKFAAGR